jgi:hypothetical protein
MPRLVDLRTGGDTNDAVALDHEAVGAELQHV